MNQKNENPNNSRKDMYVRSWLYDKLSFIFFPTSEKDAQMLTLLREFLEERDLQPFFMLMMSFIRRIIDSIPLDPQADPLDKLASELYDEVLKISSKNNIIPDDEESDVDKMISELNKDLGNNIDVDFEKREKIANELFDKINVKILNVMSRMAAGQKFTGEPPREDINIIKSYLTYLDNMNPDDDDK